MLSLSFQRIILDDNGTLVDKSVDWNNFKQNTATLPIVSAEDKLYIGSEWPFNHRYFDVSVVNSQAASVSVELWDGNSWNAAVDVIDQTASGGVSLAQSGYISWNQDIDSVRWNLEDDSEDVTELSTLRIYDKFWARLSWSADLDVTTALNYVGFKFSEDADLDVDYPDLNLSTVKDAFQSGKTDWNEQHFRAAEEVLHYLRSKNMIWSANQVIDWEQFNLAATHKVAEIIMSSFGDDYEDNRKLSRKRFFENINLGAAKRLDVNQDAVMDPRERRFVTGLVRE